MDEMTLTLDSPITEEQWDAITDVDFEHTNEINFHTKHGKIVKFVKESAQPERKKGTWINDRGLYKCSSCNRLWTEWWAISKPIERMRKECPYCPMCGSYNGEWIPVSERLPETPIRVQVQLDNGWIITAYYDEGEWYDVPGDGEPIDGVLAWMPLPEPWKGAQNG